MKEEAPVHIIAPEITTEDNKEIIEQQIEAVEKQLEAAGTKAEADKENDTNSAMTEAVKPNQSVQLPDHPMEQQQQMDISELQKVVFFIKLNTMFYIKMNSDL